MTGWPSSRTRPPLSACSPAIAQSRVDLPQPDGPSTQTSSPSRDLHREVVERVHAPGPGLVELGRLLDDELRRRPAPPSRCDADLPAPCAVDRRGSGSCASSRRQAGGPILSLRPALGGLGSTAATRGGGDGGARCEFWWSASANGRSPRQGLPQARRLRDRRPDEPDDPASQPTCPGELARLSALPGLRDGAARDAARRGLDQHLAQHPCRLRAPGDGRRLPRLHGEADRDHLRGRRTRRRQGPGEEPQAGARLHPARHHPSWAKLVEVGRTLGKPLGDAHEPQPAVLGPGLELAQEPDGEPDPDRRLRRALRRHHVPADRGQAGPRPRHRRAARRRDAKSRTTAICTSCSTTARSAGTRPAGGR